MLAHTKTLPQSHHLRFLCHQCLAKKKSLKLGTADLSFIFSADTVSVTLTYSIQASGVSY